MLRTGGPSASGICRVKQQALSTCVPRRHSRCFSRWEQGACDCMVPLARTLLAANELHMDLWHLLVILFDLHRPRTGSLCLETISAVPFFSRLEPEDIPVSLGDTFFKKRAGTSPVLRLRIKRPRRRPRSLHELCKSWTCRSQHCSSEISERGGQLSTRTSRTLRRGVQGAGLP